MSDTRSCARLCARTFQGYSLVELMIVLVIASILAAIAYPSYRDHLIEAAIPQATGGLAVYAMRMEEYYQDNRRYTGSNKACGVTAPATEKFSFSCKADSTGLGYVLTATGTTGDLTAFSYTLDQNGNEKTIALPRDWGKVPIDCWIKKKSSSC